MDFREFYEFPLELHWNKVFTKDGGMAFDFVGKWEDDKGKLSRESVVDALNGRGVAKFNGLTYKDSYIYFHDKEFISMRGWGNLTSPNCHGLSDEEAIQVQDDFAQYIISVLSLE